MNLVDLLTDAEEEQSRTKRIQGVAVGVVTDNQDPEGLCRVKVQMPWLSEDTETDWAKIATLMAGEERGSVFLPDVGDEVLLAFEHGDVNFPYVIGHLWNSAGPPPEDNADGQNNIKMLRSRSGHVIVFNDDAAARQEKVEIRTNAGHEIVLSDAAGSEKISIVDKTGGNEITIDSVTNAITIKSSLSISVESQSIDVSASNINIESKGLMSIKAAGVLTIQGAIVKIN